MNPDIIEIAQLAILAFVAVGIAWRLASSLRGIVAPFRAISDIQRRAIDLQAQAFDAQKQVSGSLAEPFRFITDMQIQLLAMHGQAADGLVQSAQAQKELTGEQRELTSAQKGLISVQQEVSAALNGVMQRTLELSERADRSARKMNSAFEAFNSKSAELSYLKQATDEVAASRELLNRTSELLMQNNLLLASHTEILARHTEFLARLEAQNLEYHRATLARIDKVSSQPSVDHIQKTLADGLREILVRDLSRTTTQYPRNVRIDLISSGIENVGRVDGGEFLATLAKVRFQLACESSNCDGHGNVFLSDSVYEINKASYFVGSVRKVTGGKDPALVLFDSIHRFDDFLMSSEAEGAKVALHISVTLNLNQPVVVAAVIDLDSTVSNLLDRVKKGVGRAEDLRELWMLISNSDFAVRDIGGAGHIQLGRMMERRDEDWNQTLFGGLTRILDVEKGYQWVCPAHAQQFMESLRKIL